MTIYLLEAYNTDSRYPNDVRYREYTTSKIKAERFNRIPKIQFSDSGHGIVFHSHEHTGKRKELRSELWNYVHEELSKIKPIKIKRLPLKSICKDALQKALDKMVEHNINDEFTETICYVRESLAKIEGK